jgi:hypothetical protein
MTDDLILKKDKQEKGFGVSKAFSKNNLHISFFKKLGINSRICISYFYSMLKTITESPLTHSVVWFVLTIIFGLIQTWIIFFTTLIEKEKTFPFDKFVTDGVLLFFAMVIISSLTIDYHIFRRTFQSKALIDFLFIFFPVVIFSLCIMIFSACYYVPDRIDINKVAAWEFIIFLMTALYAIIIKFFSLKSDKKESKHDNN